MRDLKSTIAGLLAMAVILVLLGCQRPSQEWRALGGAGVKADLLVVFCDGTNQKEINDFLFRYIETGNLGKGFKHRPGIQSIMATSIEKHDGYLVSFDPALKAEKRRELASNVAKSDVVLKVFENTAPNEAFLKTEGPELGPPISRDRSLVRALIQTVPGDRVTNCQEPGAE